MCEFVMAAFKDSPDVSAADKHGNNIPSLPCGRTVSTTLPSTVGPKSKRVVSTLGAASGTFGGTLRRNCTKKAKMRGAQVGMQRILRLFALETWNICSKAEGYKISR